MQNYGLSPVKLPDDQEAAMGRFGLEVPQTPNKVPATSGSTLKAQVNNKTEAVGTL